MTTVTPSPAPSPSPAAPTPPAPPEPTSTGRPIVRWAAPAAGVVGALGACAYLALQDPSTGGVYPLCPTKVITGIDCPLCGGLRASHDLLRGDVVGSASHNLLVVASVPLVVWAVLAWVAERRSWRHRPPPLRSTTGLWVAVGLVALVFSIVRNLPWGPGPWLFSDAA